MTDDPRLLLHLEVLRLALAAYLGRLQRLWNGSLPEADVGEVERLLIAAGTSATPTEGERQTVGQLLSAAEGTGGPLAQLSAALGLTQEDELSIAAAWWAEEDPQFAAVLGCAHDDGARRYGSPVLLRLLLTPFGLRPVTVVTDDSRLVRGGVLLPGTGSAGPMQLSPTARLVLAEEEPVEFEPPGPLPGRLASQREALVRQLDQGARGAILLRGPRGAGRRALAAESALAAGLRPVPGERPAPELRLLGHLRIAMPVVSAARLQELGWARDDPPLAAWGDAADPSGGAYTIDIQSPTRRERAGTWQRALESRDVDAAVAPLLAARFAFTEGDIDDVLWRAEADALRLERTLEAATVWDAARRQPEHALARLATLITPAFTLDDLVLDAHAREQLDELVAHVALQHIVLDDWGFRRRLPRGQGVAALFAGPPGTGKTMAAEAVANALEQDLYRVDLSAVTSKYIGETEKNLASAFEEAERAGAVLFFDEADSLFGKRTEIRDAHDRYANLEVNYLLQRVETFTGLVLLATNKSSALDEAFVRRLRFSIRFELPDREHRLALWKRSFPEEAELGELDWDALAGFELSGGSVQNAALAAAYLAASDHAPIHMELVCHALEREHEKLGRAWPGAPVEVAA